MKIFIFLFFVFIAATASSKTLQVGDLPIDMVGKNSDGSEIHISDYKGKVVIVSFWASWCEPCRKELPVLSGLQKRATAEKLQVVSINIDDDQTVFKRLVAAIGETQMKLVFDRNRKTFKQYGANGIPHMLIINSAGVIAAIHVGYEESQLPALANEINEIARLKPAR